MRSRRWRVLLLCGASGGGKTSVSYRLAKHFGLALCEVDDFVVLLKRLTTSAQHPPLHFFETTPGSEQLPAFEIVQRFLEIGRTLAPGLEAVIANHLETETPLVMEGDWILPDLASRSMFDGQVNDGRVCTVFLHEADKRQFLANYHLREPEKGPQTKRAHVSWLTGQWLAQEAGQHGWPVAPARPWATALGRVVAAVETMDG